MGHDPGLLLSRAANIQSIQIALDVAAGDRIDASWIRPPAVAGTWYPGEPDDLAASVDGYLAGVRQLDGSPLGLIVPHAGYRYSGAIAASGFKQLSGAQIGTAVVIAADHQPPLSQPISVWARGGFETPLGVLPVDEQTADRLLEHDGRIRFDPNSHALEHPIEIELPFLKRVLPDCRIVPILMMSDADDETVDLLSAALDSALPEAGVVVIASSDLSHYPSYDDAVRTDRATLRAIELGEPGAVRQTIRRSMKAGVRGLATCACGEAPILVAMKVAQARGATHATLLDYANSGDAEVDLRAQVVGYGSVMFWRHLPPSLDRTQQQVLLRIARSEVEAQVRMQPADEAAPEDPGLRRLSAVFVTLRVRGELRGCIGQLRADTELYQAVAEKATAAASADPRFTALGENELADLTVEISVLSPLQRVAYPEDIEVGRHGLAIFDQGKKGVLLPKVATERGWGRRQLLENTSLKAGLPADSWKGAAAVYRFETLEIVEAG
ncbi:MAG: AmmeMemoRadiSam system protein B [Anaerolineales bacterium]